MVFYISDNNTFKRLDLNSQLPESVYRWYTSLLDNGVISSVLASVPVKVKEVIDYPLNDESTNQQQQQGSSLRKEEGKFVDLPGAEQGKVIVRFPPEASG